MSDAKIALLLFFGAFLMCAGIFALAAVFGGPAHRPCVKSHSETRIDMIGDQLYPRKVDVCDRREGDP